MLFLLSEGFLIGAPIVSGGFESAGVICASPSRVLVANAYITGNSQGGSFPCGWISWNRTGLGRIVSGGPETLY